MLAYRAFLLDIVVLLEVMPSAEYLYIPRVLGGTALRVRNDVIKMQVFFATTLNTTSLITLPHLEFYR